MALYHQRQQPPQQWGAVPPPWDGKCGARYGASQYAALAPQYRASAPQYVPPQYGAPLQPYYAPPAQQYDAHANRKEQRQLRRAKPLPAAVPGPSPADSATPPAPSLRDEHAEIKRHVQALRSRPGGEGAQKLRILAKEISNRPMIVKAGGIPMLVVVLTNNNVHCGIKAEAARALDHLARKTSTTGSRHKIEKAGAIPPLLELVRNGATQGLNDKETKHRILATGWGAMALVRIAGNGDANRATISEALVAFIRVRGNGPGDAAAKMLGQVAQALANFAEKSAANRDAIVAAGGIAPLIVMVAKCSPGQMWAAEALGRLAYNSAKCAAIIAAGAVAPLVDLLMNGGKHEKKGATSALQALARDFESKAKIIAAGAVESLNEMLNTGGEGDRQLAEQTLRKLGCFRDSDGGRIERLQSENTTLKQEVMDERERADDQGTNAMYLTAQKSELQRLVSDAARALIDADVPTHECPDDETPFYYMLESHRDDGKQTVPWNPEAGRAMTLAEGIAWLQNNQPSKKRRTSAH